MRIPLKDKAAIGRIRESSKILARCLDYLKDYIQPGISTGEIDRLADNFIRQANAVPSFKGFRGYPASVCISLNDEVVHGIPSPRRIIQDGDIVSLDVGVYKDGYHGDGAWSYIAGRCDPGVEKLLQVTRTALMSGIEQARVGNHLGDIGAMIQNTCEGAGFSVVRDLVGHGIGQQLHEPPQIPNYGRKNSGPLLCAGMTLAIEPMINMGSYDVETLDDGWTIVTADHSLSAHFEHTIVINPDGPEILTKLS
ncbi:MAG: type I methionyl aminopeptidase [Candidatus Delongbacteria bacterium]|nr:type I methionyl aminopeptidase [Candidatus Delongbacteria bacterium]